MATARVLEAESTLTDRYQTTVPQLVRKALNLGKSDKLIYKIRPNGEVVLVRAVVAQQEDDDPALAPFLAFLASDMRAHPEHLRPVSGALVKRAQGLTAGVVVDRDEPLPADDE
jgi:antitoxin PrlF